MKLFKRFTFEAAHTLSDYPQMHGHSYYVEVWLYGNASDGYVIRESEIDMYCSRIKTMLDHKYLNDVMALPTSENIAKFIWDNLEDLPLYEIKVERPTVGMGVVYSGKEK